LILFHFIRFHFILFHFIQFRFPPFPSLSLSSISFHSISSILSGGIELKVEQVNIWGWVEIEAEESKLRWRR
jgi:hypothetical protein